MIASVRGFSPQIGHDCFVAENATIVGDVEIGPRSSIWYNVVLRGDVMPLRIAEEVNIQDGTIVHGTYGQCGVTLERRVTVGHLAMLHGCHVGEASLIGMGAIVMDHVKLPKHSLVGAGSLVVENSQFLEEGWLILGRPAKAIRRLTSEEIQKLELSADNYLLYKSWYLGIK